MRILVVSDAKKEVEPVHFGSGIELEMVTTQTFLSGGFRGQKRDLVLLPKYVESSNHETCVDLRMIAASVLGGSSEKVKYYNEDKDLK